MSWPDGLVVATHNPGKLAEWRALLGPVDDAASLGLDEPDEPHERFTDNARHKATRAAQACGRPCLAEDAGLVVPALGGRPGVRTKREALAAGGGAALAEALVGELGLAEAEARYVCALALVWPDGRVVTAEAASQGTLVRPRGEGPGLCPSFVPAGSESTWAELGADWRRDHDHRALALASLRRQLP